MIPDLKYLLATFPAGERRRLWLYVVAQFVVALLDLLGVAVIFPLMQVALGTPLDEGLVGALYRFFGSPDRNRFVVTLASLMVLSFVAKAALALALSWWSTGVITRLQTRTSRRLLSNYLTESYLEHRRRDTGEVMSTVGVAVQAAHVQVVGGLLSALSASLSIGFIVALLLAVAPLPTLSALVYFTIAVYVLQRHLAPANRQAGTEAQHTAWISSHALLDAMSGFRESVLHDAQPYFIERFHQANVRNAQASRRANFFSSTPKYVLELVAMVGITILIVVSMLAGSARTAMPTLSLFVGAIVKILPLMVALTATLGLIRVGREGLRTTVAALRATSDGWPVGTPDPGPALSLTPAPIQVRDVSVRYPGATRDVLHQISLDVSPGSSLALCGPSGSGKTTFVDTILGLIPPTSGTITYGDVPITAAARAWHDVVAYVPQDVFITDDDLAGNVAFGIPAEERDEQRVLECLHRAELTELLEQLPDGVQTLVGERGSRLSGGQRQRVGIARALYRDPQVIVLDEATSALDNETEHKITTTLNSLRGDITTVLVAHRLSTVRSVDNLVYLVDGRIESMGSFDQVVASSTAFARMVALGRLQEDVKDPGRPA